MIGRRTSAEVQSVPPSFCLAVYPSAEQREGEDTKPTQQEQTQQREENGHSLLSLRTESELPRCAHVAWSDL
jgi:hypothetical protein